VNGYFDRLGEELRLATHQRYVHRGTEHESLEVRAGSRLSRWRGRVVRFALGRVGRWPRLGVLAILAVGGTAVAAAIPLLAGSHRLAGVVPQAALSSSGRLVDPAAAALPYRLPDGLRYAIPVIPDLEAGNAGWCAYPVFALAGAVAPLPDVGGACAPATARPVTIVGGGVPLTNVLNSLSGPRAARPNGALPSVASLEQAMRDASWLNFLVISDQVAVVKIGSASFEPQSEPELAPGWRAVVTFTRGPITGVLLLDRRSRPINQWASQRSVDSVPVTTVNPRDLPSAVCSLGSSDLPGLGSEWEVVANATPSRGPRVDQDVLFSCATAWYAFLREHAVYSAAILLNAQNPVLRAPNLPGLTPSIRPGDYEEATGTAGQTTARRIGNAWLLVQGPNQQLRVARLDNITTAGTAIHR
jgi:hypothetical protein